MQSIKYGKVLNAEEVAKISQSKIVSATCFMCEKISDNVAESDDDIYASSHRWCGNTTYTVSGTIPFKSKDAAQKFIDAEVDAGNIGFKIEDSGSQFIVHFSRNFVVPKMLSAKESDFAMLHIKDEEE